MLYNIKNACNDDYLKFDDFEQAKKDTRIAIENYIFSRKKKILLAPEIDCDSDQNEWSFRFSLPNYAFGILTSADVSAHFHDEKITLQVSAHIMFDTPERGRLDKRALDDVVQGYNFVGAGGDGGLRITMDPESITLNEGFINHICDVGQILYNRKDQSDVELAVDFMLDQLMGALYAIELKKESILSKPVKESDEAHDESNEAHEEYDEEFEEIQKEVSRGVAAALEVDSDLYDDEYDDEERTGMTISDLKYLMSEIKERVVGQDEYADSLAFAIYEGLNGYPKNMIVVGPTGSGKTFTVKTAQAVLEEMGIKVGYFREDISTYTPNGFKGKDIDIIKKKILHEMFMERDLIIVYLDEIDKLFSEEYDGEGKNVNQDLQGEMLSLLSREGIASSKEGNKTLSKCVMFVCTGAFVGLDEIEDKYRKDTVGIGFNNGKDIKKSKITENIKLEQLLLEYGAIPEFLGRTNYFMRTNSLTRNDYYNITMNPKYGVAKEVKNEYKKFGYDIDFRKNLIEEIVDCAYSQPVGARYIKSALALAAKNSLMEEIKNDKPIRTKEKLMVCKKNLE